MEEFVRKPGKAKARKDGATTEKTLSTSNRIAPDSTTGEPSSKTLVNPPTLDASNGSAQPSPPPTLYTNCAKVHSLPLPNPKEKPSVAVPTSQWSDDDSGTSSQSDHPPQ